MTPHQQPQLSLVDQLLIVAGAGHSPQNVLQKALDTLLERCDQSMGCIYLQEHGELQRATVHGPKGIEPPDRLGYVGTPLKGRCLQVGVCLPIPSEGDAASELETFCRSAGYQRMLALPLSAHHEQIGCLFIATQQDRARQIEEQDWNTIGRIIGLGYETARSNSRLQEQLHKTETLYAVSQAFSATLDLDELLNQIVRAAVDTITEADNCVLHLLIPETGELRPRALSFDRIDPQAIGRSQMRIGHGVAGQALENGELVNIGDVANDPRFVRSEGGRRYAAMMVVPLRLKDQPLGTLSADSQRVNAFSEDDERLLTVLANQAAIAIENAQLVADLQRSLQELKQTQAQLVQSEKLSAIGQLIAGVAHELNNPLTAVMGYSQLLQMEPGLAEPIARDISKIYSQSQRASRIVQNLLTFARQTKAQRQYVELNEVMRATLELRGYQLRVENIHLHTDLAEEPLGAMADASQLQQVFLNLINNAQDAMVEYRHGGNLTIRSRRERDRVIIELEDDGPGLSPTVKQHLFEPFFTTKEVGKGTGLGLSICFGIIGQHNGRIMAESEMGQGTTFVIDLPWSAKPKPKAADQAQEQPQAPRDKHILVVEDEAEIGTLVVRLLKQAGHHVYLAQNGEAAVRLLAERDRSTPFDMIISDVKMPGLGAPELYDHICKFEPRLANRVLLITGDTLSPKTQTFLKRTHLPYLAKPFRVDALLRHVAQLLRGEPSASAIRRY